MTPRIPVTKMSGAGNDFLVVDGEAARSLGGAFVPWIRAVCRRGLSVGADGVLVVEISAPGRVRVEFLNPDGRRAFCGNGSRCAARYAHARRLAGTHLILETDVGPVPAEIAADFVRIQLPIPRDLGTVGISAGGETLLGRRVDAGAPHFVVDVEDVGRAPLERWGPLARSHAEFGTEGTNLDLASRRPDGAIELRTWERGVEGETLSCGSGAVAAALAARVGGAPESSFVVIPRSGIALGVTFEPDGETVSLRGDARFVFEGTVDPEAVEPVRSC